MPLLCACNKSEFLNVETQFIYGVADKINTKRVNFSSLVSLSAWIGRNFKGVLFYLRAQNSHGKIL